MAFDDFENSNYDGVPTLLYEFSIGENFWRYASSESDLVLGADTYLGISISDSGVVQTGDATNDDFTVSMPANTDFAKLFVGTPPSSSLYLTVRQKDLGDDAAPVVWIGRVLSCKRVSQVAVEVSCQMLTASLNRTGLRLCFSRNCPHALYDLNCRVDQNAFAVVVEVESLAGASVTSAALDTFDDNYFAGGFMEFNLLPGVLERRAIETHTGSTVAILGTNEGLKVGDFITVLPGCDRTIPTCDTKFNNMPNYGGFPHLPGKSPFGGDPVF